MSVDNGFVSLRQHVDQRFADLSSARVEQTKHLNDLLSQMDIRYQQRFDAQNKALEAAITDAEKAVQAALAASEKAVTKAETATEKRFDAVNEFRIQLTEQASTFVRQDVLTAIVASTDRRLADLNRDSSLFRDEIRTEMLAYRDALQREIADLRESRSQLLGGDSREATNRTQTNWAFGLAISVVLSIASIITAIIIRK